MIKEIEVGGAKHSITLADDMVGSGLVKEPSGKVLVSVSTDVLSGGYFMTGLAFSEGKLILQKEPIANALSGPGLISQYGSLTINKTGLAQDNVLLSGLAVGLASGLVGNWEKGWERSLVSGLAGGLASGLASGLVSGLANSLAGSGLFEEDGRMVVDISSSSGLFFDYIVGPRPSTKIGINIARRTSGLRLFFTENGELDVTQD